MPSPSWIGNRDAMSCFCFLKDCDVCCPATAAATAIREVDCGKIGDPAPPGMAVNRTAQRTRPLVKVTQTSGGSASVVAKTPTAKPKPPSLPVTVKDSGAAGSPSPSVSVVGASTGSPSPSVSVTMVGASTGSPSHSVSVTKNATVNPKPPSLKEMDGGKIRDKKRTLADPSACASSSVVHRPLDASRTFRFALKAPVEAVTSPAQERRTSAAVGETSGCKAKKIQEMDAGKIGDKKRRLADLSHCASSSVNQQAHDMKTPAAVMETSGHKGKKIQQMHRDEILEKKVKARRSSSVPLAVQEALSQPAQEKRTPAAVKETLFCEGTAAEAGSHGFIHRLPGPPCGNKLFVEACAGTCRLASSVAKLNVPSQSFEFTRSWEEDVFQHNPPCFQTLFTC